MQTDLPEQEDHAYCSELLKRSENELWAGSPRQKIQSKSISSLSAKREQFYISLLKILFKSIQ